MTKEDILKLYIADLNNLVADSDAKRSRIIDLEDELEALKQGQTLPIDSVVGQSELLKAFADWLQSDTANLNYDFRDLVDEYLESL